MEGFLVVVCGIIVSGIMTVTLITAYYTSSDETSLLDWAAAGGFFMCANLFALVYYTTSEFSFFKSSANGLVFLAHLFLFFGVQRQVGQTPKYWISIVLFLIIQGINYLPVIQDSMSIRILLFYPFIAFISCLSIYSLINHSKIQFSHAHMLLIFAFSIWVILLCVGFLHQFNIHFLDHRESEAQLINSIGRISQIGFIFLITVAFIHLIQWKKEDILRQVSIKDDLTKWYNRHALDNIASAEFDRSIRNDIKMAFLNVDIDEMKKINESYGMIVGDNVIESFCRITESLTRQYDNRFRIGGEEFSILISDTSHEELSQIAERIRTLIEENPISHSSETIQYTVSLGVGLQSVTDRSWQDVFDRANLAIFQSKKDGKNQVSFAPA